MNGSAFDPMAEGFDYVMDEEKKPPQCNVSMQELFLQKATMLKLPTIWKHVYHAD
jgi:hypothetical protein